ncbi:MAG: hypothetical protein J6O09_01375 [Lachnospiraceae bacterium]|nr:hypothetical protein [Lachnospiraceae bacterium]
MRFKFFKKYIAQIVFISLVLSSCSLSKTQSVIDNIIPDHTKRMYTISDLTPYTYKEIRNAQAFYGQDLTDFFYANTATAAEAKRETKKEKDAFYKELLFRNHNYKIIKKRFGMYVEDESKSQETKESERQKEYDDYYKLQNAEGGNIIKKYNDGKLSGMPLMSIRIDMSTATMSDIESIYSTALCEIYKPVVIEESVYEKLAFGDTIDLVVPATNSTVNASETKKVTCTYIATDSLMYKDDKGEESYYYIADIDGINEVRRILDYDGSTLETYAESKELQIMSNARVVRANDMIRLMMDVSSDSLTEYNYGDLAVRALSGGYLVQEYKDYVYANSISTNLKGYITSLTEYDNQAIDIEFYTNH